MRTLGYPILATALALVLNGAAAVAKPTQAQKPTDITGMVRSVDTTGKSFVLNYKKGWGRKAPEQNVTVMTKPGTTFRHVGMLPLTRKRASFADLKTGEKVEVRGMPAGDGSVGATYVLIKHEPKR